MRQPKRPYLTCLSKRWLPNIEFDKERTDRAKTAAMDAVKPVIQQVHVGQMVAGSECPRLQLG